MQVISSYTSSSDLLLTKNILDLLAHSINCTFSRSSEFSPDISKRLNILLVDISTEKKCFHKLYANI